MTSVINVTNIQLGHSSHWSQYFKTFQNSHTIKPNFEVFFAIIAKLHNLLF